MQLFKQLEFPLQIKRVDNHPWEIVLNQIIAHNGQNIIEVWENTKRPKRSKLK